MERGPLLRRVGITLEAAFVAAAAAFMMWARLIPYGKYAGSDRVHFIGTDPYYHYRAVLVSVNDFPRLLRWDPWTNYPTGTITGQFGTIFDLLIAIAAHLTGDASDPHHVARVVAAAPAVFGGLAAIPIYLLARRIHGRTAGVWAVVVAALLPGEFYIRSIAGYADHHIAEVVFGTLAVFLVLVALQAGKKWDTGIPRWKCLAPAGGAALALFLYIWTWPPGVLLVGVLGIVVALQLLVEQHLGKDTRGLAYAAAVSFAAPALPLLFMLDRPTFTFNIFTLIQPIGLIGVAAGALLLDRAGRELRARKLSPWFLPAGGAALVVAALAVLAVTLPDLYANIKFGVTWITGTGNHANLQTIQEVRPSCDFAETWPFCSTFNRAYGFTLLAALATVPVLVGRYVKRQRLADLTLLVWLLAMVVAATNQVRFTYYLAVPVAISNGYLLAWASRTTGLTRLIETLGREEEKPKRRRGRRVRTGGPALKWHQPVSVAVVLAVAMPGLVDATDATYPTWEMGEVFSPAGELLMWEHGLLWMKDNTPDAGMDLATSHRYGDRHAWTYPDETYGVLAWWDYGHWIQTIAERPPVANPFQQSATFASLYFTDTSEEAAVERLAEREGDGFIRYVVIGDSDAGGKFAAITVWANRVDPDRAVYAGGAHTAGRTYQLPTGEKSLTVTGPEYRESMMSRLYFDYGDGLAHHRLVYAHPAPVIFGSLADADGNLLCFHAPIPSGRCPYNIDHTRLPGYRSSDHQVVDVGGVYIYDWRVVPSLQVHERVPGATLTGTANPGATVTVSVPLTVDYGGTTQGFDYTRTTTAGDDGTWNLTVSYATTDPVPVADGGTASMVEAEGAYAIRYDGLSYAVVEVPDATVLEGGTIDVDA